MIKNMFSIVVILFILELMYFAYRYMSCGLKEKELDLRNKKMNTYSELESFEEENEIYSALRNEVESNKYTYDEPPEAVEIMTNDMEIDLYKDVDA